MSTDEVNQILVSLAVFRAEVTGRLDSIVADNARGEVVHKDHEARLRTLEANSSEGRGVWKVLTAGGAIGALAATAIALILRSFGA